MTFLKVRRAFVLLVLCSAGLIVTCSHAAEKIDAEKVKEIRTMLELTGASKMAAQMMNQMLDSMKGTKDLTNSQIERMKKRLASGSDELVELTIPIYDKYYSIEDLKAVNAFYSSSAGQKYLQSMPQVVKESMKVGQEWGAKMAKRIVEELEAADQATDK
jgi:hypothetical protein